MPRRQVEIDAVVPSEQAGGQLHQGLADYVVTGEGQPEGFARLVLGKALVGDGAGLEPVPCGRIEVADQQIPYA